MNGELYINGKDAFEVWGVNMGEGFLDSITAPVPLKANIENESRLEHGKRVIVNPKMSSRNVTLVFTLMAENESSFKTRRTLFYEELYKGKVSVYIPDNGEDIYHLIYLNSTSFAQNRNRTFCKISVKFEEPNPSLRT